MENLKFQIELLERRIAGDQENYEIMKSNLSKKKAELRKLKRKLKRRNTKKA